MLKCESSHFFSYEKGENGYPKIVESEAIIVRKIYDLFYFKGKTPTYIATYLTEKKILSPSGKEIWQSSTVESILTNEKYKGDAFLQKTFTVDFLSKKKKVNEGEIQQYYLEGSHQAIISPELFDLVQNTEESYGSVTANSETKKNAKLRIWMKKS